MDGQLGPKALYAYLHQLVGSATDPNDGCSKDLLDCDCGAYTCGADLVDALFVALRRLRGKLP